MTPDATQHGKKPHRQYGGDETDGQRRHRRSCLGRKPEYRRPAEQHVDVTSEAETVDRRLRVSQSREPLVVFFYQRMSSADGRRSKLRLCDGAATCWLSNFTMIDNSRSMPITHETVSATVVLRKINFKSRGLSLFGRQRFHVS